MITDKLIRSLKASEQKLAFEYLYNEQTDRTTDPDKMNPDTLKRLELVYKRIMLNVD